MVNNTFNVSAYEGEPPSETSESRVERKICDRQNRQNIIAGFLSYIELRNEK